MQYASETAAIIDLLNTQARAWSDSDLHGFMQHYWNDPALYYASCGNRVRGWKPLLDSYRRRYGEGGNLGQTIFSDLEIDVLAADVAKVHGCFEVRVKGASTAAGSYTLVLRKFADMGWLIIADQVSPEVVA